MNPLRMQQIHWFPFEHRINFKMANITFNTLHYMKLKPAYLHSLLYFHTPGHSLRSSNANLLTIPFAHTLLHYVKTLHSGLSKSNFKDHYGDTM